jgi:hypothetical protein
MPRKRVVLIVGIILTAGIAAVVVVYCLMGNPFDPFDDSRFSVEAWRSADPKSRARMARDVIRHYLTPGTTEERVTSLVGKPDEVIEGADAGGHWLPGARSYSYRLGSWSLYGFDDAFLYIHIDRAGKVIVAEVTGH